MIIELLLNLVYTLLNILTSPINIPSLPEEVDEYMSAITNALCIGLDILANYIPVPYVFTCFTVILAVDIGIAVYHFVMWILRKIPMASIS